MPSIHLELIAESDSNYGAASRIELPVAIHIHKRLEQFMYTAKVKDSSTLIAYLENRSFNSRDNLKLINKTFNVPENNYRHTLSKQNIRVVNSKAITVEYSNILATNIATIDSIGKEIPLFWKHELPNGTTSAVLTKVEDGVESLIDSGYIVDLAAQAIYTNYQNSYDESTARTTAYYVGAGFDGFTTPISDDDRFTTPISDDDRFTGTGNQESFNPSNYGHSTKSKQLLDLVPVAREATWEDIDLNTDTLYLNKQLYTRTKSASGYTFNFNKGDRWWVRALEEGLLQPKPPSAIDPGLSWHMQFTAGDVSALVNNKVRRYYVPEFNYQNFSPYKPLKYLSYDTMNVVTKNLLFANKQKLAIFPDQGLHLTLYIYDETDELIKVLTTDTTLDGVRYKNSVFYETELIDSWDNSSGCISMGMDIFNTYKIIGSYYYKVDTYEYVGVNLNPLVNPKIKDTTVVFYCIPDVDEADTSINYLIVDNDGKIIFCSQANGINYSNLKLKNANGTFNENTVVGMSYYSEVDSDNFTTLYTAGYSNDNAYMILCEVSLSDFILVEDQLKVDLIEDGFIIKKANLKDAILANPKIQHSAFCDAPFGLQIPEENVLVLEAPLSLIEDYGGVLTKEQVESYLRVLMPAASYMAIEWVYPKSELTVNYNGTAITLYISFEGLYTYNVYRSSLTEEKTLLTTLTPGARASLSYEDTNIVSGTTYKYYVSLVSNSIEYPETTLKIKVV